MKHSNCRSLKCPDMAALIMTVSGTTIKLSYISNLQEKGWLVVLNNALRLYCHPKWLIRQHNRNVANESHLLVFVHVMLDQCSTDNMTYRATSQSLLINALLKCMCKTVSQLATSIKRGIFFMQFFSFVSKNRINNPIRSIFNSNSSMNPTHNGCWKAFHNERKK